MEPTPIAAAAAVAGASIVALTCCTCVSFPTTHVPAAGTSPTTAAPQAAAPPAEAPPAPAPQASAHAKNVPSAVQHAHGPGYAWDGTGPLDDAASQMLSLCLRLRKTKSTRNISARSVSKLEGLWDVSNACTNKQRCNPRMPSFSLAVHRGAAREGSS